MFFCPEIFERDDDFAWTLLRTCVIGLMYGLCQWVFERVLHGLC